MIKTQHTAGPWSQTSRGDIIGNGATLAVVGAASSSITIAEDSANAYLIAAAPELLAACEKQLEWLKHIKTQVTAPESVLLGFEQSSKYLSAAIAKSKGE